jgi:hypothetical protein
MSVDTIERMDDKVNTDLEIGEGYYVVYESLNEDLPEQFSGPFISFSVETFTDSVVNDTDASFMEEGVLVFQIFDEKGSGTRDLYTYRDVIRDNFRQQQIQSGVGEYGMIILKEISQRPPVEVRRGYGEINWVRLDVLISYVKCYEV